MTKYMENKKTILSFDVGIKNLAYCIIEKNDIEFKILNWGVINLIDDVEKCMFEIKGGKKCDKPANFKICHKDNEIMYLNETNTFSCCEGHKKKSMPSFIKIDKNIKVKKKPNKKSKIIKEDDIIPMCMYCENESDYFISTNKFCGLCELHVKKFSKKIEKNIQAKKINVMNCNEFPLLDLGKILFEKFDNNNNFLKVDEVLIENQPGRLNNRIKVGNKIKTIASFIFSYFIIRGIIEKDRTCSSITNVKFVSASNKLKIDLKTTNKILEKNETKNERDIYNLTKNLGKQYCCALINSEDRDILNKNKKKDDMCDAFLQGFQYLFNPVPEKYVKMLKNVDFSLTKKIAEKITDKIKKKE
jgi:hypothetical protein